MSRPTRTRTVLAGFADAAAGDEDAYRACPMMS
jgi:hypothetical protein